MTFTRNSFIEHLVVSVLIASSLAPLFAGGPAGPSEEPTPIIFHQIAVDTIPLEDRYGDFIRDKSTNPFDILPSELEQTVEYDPETDSYIVYEKLGDEYFRTPTTMTFEEYLEWRGKEQEKRYFNKLAGIGDGYKSNKGRFDPMAKVDIEKQLVDRLFGGNGITIEPQGSLDLTFGSSYTRNENPYVRENQRQQFNPIDFDMDIQMNVDGKIGDKMDLGFNYDTNASFDFDRKIKLAYDSEKWTEDDIIKKIELGNVSLPLRSTLIQGAQELFGIKTELQFGKLRLTGIMSQQKSEQESIQIQNGAQEQEFILRPEDYDENRHFFISHYHRNAYEEALENLPYINNSFRITNIEVWVSDDRANFQTDQTMICALADIAEPDEIYLTNPNKAAVQLEDNLGIINRTTDIEGRRLPDNRVNNLFEKVTEDQLAQRTKSINRILQGTYQLEQKNDYELYRGRKLSPSEFFFNPELGFVSLNVKLRPNQVMSVGYEYFYTNNCEDVYKVGATSDEGSVPNTDRSGQVKSEGVIFTKLIKSSSQRVDLPAWDLMMKNVYPLRTNQLDPEGFEFDIFYEDDDDRNGSQKKFLPISQGNFENIALLDLFGLDKLNRNNDPQQDGIFDFVPGITVIPQNGSLIFPVLEPFGQTISDTIGGALRQAGVAEAEIESLQRYYSFPELYDTSVTGASLKLENNKFVMIGKVKTTSSSEYSLGAWNIPEGSVTVRAGSQNLVEGVDYEVDYGQGKVRIINQSIIQQGVPVNISFEDNSIFSLQQKNMMGLRAEYEISENFYVGGTALRLQERPFTQKVNIGDDPIKNKIYGFDIDYSKESPWVTKFMDKLPFYSTNSPSNINFSAEVAALRPGHNKAINNNASDDSPGVVSIDDFEGAVSGYPLSSQPNRWTLASIPRYKNSRDNDWPESTEIGSGENESVNSGVNRARLSWYVLDDFVQADPVLKNENSFTRRIQQAELFLRDVPQGQLSDLLTFDLSYFPDERGPYNFDLPDGIDVNGQRISEGLHLDPASQQIRLNAPETRWAGIQRYLNNNDFEAANYEFIEFWLLNPYGQKPSGEEPHTADESGFLTFHLGNVSEDILYDDQQFYENSLPKDGVNVESCPTAWGNVPLSAPINDAFPGQNFAEQDLGLDGLNNNDERAKYEYYLNELNGIGLPQSIIDDPSADDYVFFNNPIYDTDIAVNNVLERYKLNNNPQGNSPDVSSERTFQRGNPNPDKEDLNNNRSLDSDESFYEYKLKLTNDGGEIDQSETDYIRDTKVIDRNGTPETWYRVRIPLNEGVSINGIQGFRSIQFIRMLTHGFATSKTFRLAEFELIRNQWRKLDPSCGIAGDTTPVTGNPQLSIDIVGVEENLNKQPFGYVVPRGIKQEQTFGSFAAVTQDENSLVMKYNDLDAGCEVKIGKLNELDLRVYERMQMFVHAEGCTNGNNTNTSNILDGNIKTFIRLGKDFERHYYQYEIPVTLSKQDTLLTELSDRIWPVENYIDFKLDLLIQLKKLRNVLKHPVNEVFSIDEADLLKDDIAQAIIDYPSISFTEVIDGESVSLFKDPKHRVSIIGNPNLGLIKGVSLGVRNDAETGNTHCGEVWVNELRLSGLQERAGVAGLARLDIQLADLGSITAATTYTGIGWGGLNDKTADRAKEEVIEYDIATNLELGKFFPQHWGMSIPFYAQYAKSITNPEFDAFDFDITRKDEADLFKNEPIEVQRDVQQRSQQVTTIKTYNFTNVRKQRGTKKKVRASKPEPKRSASNSLGTSSPKKKKNKKAMPWDISNFSASYGYTENAYRDHILSEDKTIDQYLGLDYTYARKGKGITPFKKIVKSKSLKILKELNFNPVPNSFTFNSTINRFQTIRRYRLPTEPIFQFNDNRFDWERNYDLNWNLTKALKLNYSAQNLSYIDEARQVGVADDPADREWTAFRDDDGDGFLEPVSVTDEVIADPGFVKQYWKDNLKSGGRNTEYDHNIAVSYSLPTKLIPYMDWMDIKGQYRATYGWSAGALIRDFENKPLAGVIQNTQNRSVTANLNFDKLYRKSKYLQSLDKRGKTKSTKKRKTSGDAVSVTKDKQGRTSAKKKTRNAGLVEKLFVRPLFLLRSARLTYKEDYSTVIPGFTGTPEFFGLENFNSPGLDFVFGFQPNLDADSPNNYFDKMINNGWITESLGQNQELTQIKAQKYEAKFKIEPWKDFRLDVDFKKNYRVSHSEVFKNVIKIIDDEPVRDFANLAGRDLGSFDMTYYNMNTLFGTDIDALFQTFEGNRPTISQRLNNRNPNPTTDPHERDGVDYAVGYGKQSSKVLIPAFIAAYTAQDPNTVDLDMEETVKKRTFIPKPNWSLRYDGLTKMPWFKDKFSSFTIEHAYSSRLRVASFNTDVEYDPTNPFGTEDNPNVRLNGNYYTRIEIPAIQVNENFNPVIGLKMKTRSDFTLEFEYVKSRNLNLKINTSSQLEEDKKTGFVFGLGYTIKDSNFLQKNQKKKRKSKSRADKDAKDKKKPRISTGGKVTSDRGSDMTFMLNVAWNDNQFFVHELDSNKLQQDNETRGDKSLQISPSVDYLLNENVTLRAFFDYDTTTPYGSTNFKRTNIAGGIVMSLSLSN